MISGTDILLVLFFPINSKELYQDPIPSNSQPINGFKFALGNKQSKHFDMARKAHSALLATLTLATVHPFRFI